jgi:hypothetical protein
MLKTELLKVTLTSKKKENIMQNCTSTPIHIWAISHGYTSNDNFFKSFKEQQNIFSRLLENNKNMEVHTDLPDADALELYAKHRHIVIMSSAELDGAEIFGVWENSFAVFANCSRSAGVGALRAFDAESLAKLEEFKSIGSLSAQPGVVFDEYHFGEIVAGFKAGCPEETIKTTCAPFPHLYKFVLDDQLVLSRDMGPEASCEWFKTLDIDDVLRELLVSTCLLLNTNINFLLGNYRTPLLLISLKMWAEDTGISATRVVTHETFEKWAKDINLFLEESFKPIFSESELQRYEKHYQNQG